MVDGKIPRFRWIGVWLGAVTLACLSECLVPVTAASAPQLPRPGGNHKPRPPFLNGSMFGKRSVPSMVDSADYRNGDEMDQAKSKHYAAIISPVTAMAFRYESLLKGELIKCIERRPLQQFDQCATLNALYNEHKKIMNESSV